MAKKTWQELKKMGDDIQGEDIGLASFLIQLALARKADETVFAGVQVIEAVIANDIQKHIDKIYHPEKVTDEYEDWLENG